MTSTLDHPRITKNFLSDSSERVFLHDRRALVRTLTSSFLGNFIEWFDYASYSYFATVLASRFFPHSSPSMALIQTFAVFALSFVLRPVGALFWGARGDRHGRKDTLSSSILLMSLATFLIGCLPGYSTIGLAAPIVLLALRMCQSFSASGEYAGAATFISELTGRDSRGLASAIVPASTAVGLLAGSLLFTVESHSMSSGAMASWGWRVPFLLAGPLGVVAFMLRSRLEETPVFRELERVRRAAGDQEPTPVRDLLVHHRRALGLSLGASTLNAVGFYVVLTYLPTYLTETLHVGATTAGSATSITLVAYVALVLVGGRLSDTMGRKRIMLAAAIAFAVLSVPAFLVMGLRSFVPILFAQLCLAAILALNDGSLCSYLPENFPSAVRLSGFALSFNVANAVFGGTAPLVATLLIRVCRTSLAPAIYLVVVALVAAVCIHLSRLHQELGA